MYAVANGNDLTARFPYHRFNVARDMDKINLTEWQKCDEMTAAAREFLSEGTVRIQINECVEWMIQPSESVDKQCPDTLLATKYLSELLSLENTQAMWGKLFEEVKNISLDIPRGMQFDYDHLLLIVANCKAHNLPKILHQIL